MLCTTDLATPASSLMMDGARHRCALDPQGVSYGEKLSQVVTWLGARTVSTRPR